MDIIGKLSQKNKPGEDGTDKKPNNLQTLSIPQSPNRPINSRASSRVGGGEGSQLDDQVYMGVNQILVYKFKQNKPIYYVPCYLRMGVVRVRQINYIQTKATIQTELRIWVQLKDFPEIVRQQIMAQTKLTINSMNKQALSQLRQPPKLDQSYIRNVSKKSLGFIISQEMQLDIESDPFWSPFQLIQLVANLEIKKIVIGDTQNSLIKTMKEEQRVKFQNAEVQFNFLDAHPFLQFSFGQVRNLGSFDIAQSMVDMQWTNDSGKPQDDQQEGADASQQPVNQDVPLNLLGKVIGLQQKVKKEKLLSGQQTPDAYQHGRIVIPLYKYPSTTIINVFVPFYIVAIMNLGVFFQLNDMSNRDASLATYQLAYIAFFPTIRQNLPETPKLVFSQIMVYLQSICTLLCFFYSLYVNMTPDYVFDWQTNQIFLTCMILTILNMSTVGGLFFIHKVVWERRYNKLPPNTHKYLDAKTMNTDDCDEWWNHKCQEQFKQPIQLGLVKPFKRGGKKRGRVQVTKNPLDVFLGEGLPRQEPNSSSKIHPIPE